MVAYIIAIGLLVAGVAWYLYSGLGESDVAPVIRDNAGTPFPKGTWVGVGNAQDGAFATRTNPTQGKTGYSPPPRAAQKVTSVPPSVGPAITSRSGVGHF